MAGRGGLGHLAGINMIRINLVDNTTSVMHIDFHVVPVTNGKDFACVPEGILPLRAVIGAFPQG